MGKGLLLFVLLFIILIIGFIFMGDKLPFTEKAHNKLSDRYSKDSAPPVVESTIEDNEWCYYEELFYKGDEMPKKDTVMGWDKVNNCCLERVEGYNCALHKDSVVEYCYTAMIGGDIKYVKVNNVNVDKTIHKEFINDLDKFKIQNKPCDIEKYPEVLRRLKG